MSQQRFTGEMAARWYFWDGGFLAIGRSRGVIPTHSHHAVQMFISLDGPNKVKYADGEWQGYDAAIVGADEPHAYDAHGHLGAMLLIDPETREGRWLQQSLRAPVQAMQADRVPLAQEMVRKFIDDPGDEAETSRFVLEIIRLFGTGIMPQRTIDARVAQAIAAVQAMDTRVASLEEIASKVFLSPSRFAHLFSDEVGIPFRRYLLWRRLTRAMLLATRGHTLSRAAHEAGFTDAAHFTRTFYQMFGIPPSAMLGQGEMYEIPAP